MVTSPDGTLQFVHDLLADSDHQLAVWGCRPEFGSPGGFPVAELRREPIVGLVEDAGQLQWVISFGPARMLRIAVPERQAGPFRGLLEKVTITSSSGRTLSASMIVRSASNSIGSHAKTSLRVKRKDTLSLWWAISA